jgi:TolA-binding protein
MFSEANRLRKSGRLGDAERAYRRLQQTHPQSDQASVSRVLLGRLLLGRGQLQAAHREFSRYLAAHARGSLAEEALQGSAMALRALGRQNDERAVWQTLLNRFPGSIYASRARERLRELSVQLGPRLAPEPQ